MRHMRHMLAGVQLTARRRLAAALNAEGADGLLGNICQRVTCVTPVKASWAHAGQSRSEQCCP